MYGYCIRKYIVVECLEIRNFEYTYWHKIIQKFLILISHKIVAHAVYDL